jgi:Phosphotransferase enzyme family
MDSAEAGLAWATTRLAALGYLAIGPAEPVKAVAWSTVYAIPTADGRVWFKANGGDTRYEAALAAALGTWAPDRVLVPLAIEPERGWQLLPDGGTPLREHEANLDPDTWARFLAEYAELQRRVTPYADQMLRLGVPDHRPESMPDHLAALLDDPDLVIADDARAALRRLRPAYADACARLAGTGPPATIQHDDLHSNNMLPMPDSDRFFDWGDASVAHPFTTLLVTLRSFAYTLDVKTDDPVVRRVRDAYLEPWGLGTDGPELADLATWTGIPGRALSWRRGLVAAGPADLETYGDAVAGWLTELLDRP